MNTLDSDDCLLIADLLRSYIARMTKYDIWRGDIQRAQELQKLFRVRSKTQYVFAIRKVFDASYYTFQPIASPSRWPCSD